MMSIRTIRDNKMAIMAFFAVLTCAIAHVSSQEYCNQVENQGLTDCHSCVEITILSGRPDCAYCSAPFSGMAWCAPPFYPPAAKIPGLTAYACYNDSGVPGPFQYQPRCRQKHCYIDQCLVSGAVLWYIIVPIVLGTVLCGTGTAVLCWCRKTSKASIKKWLDNEGKKENKSAEKRKTKSDQRHAERDKKTAELRKKYMLDEYEEDGLI